MMIILLIIKVIMIIKMLIKKVMMKTKIQLILIYKSEEIKFVNANKLNEEDKNNENNDIIREKNVQPSEITTKSI